MKRSVAVAVLGVLVVIAVVGWMRPVRAQEAGVRWEYCDIGSRALSGSTFSTTIYYYGVAGVRRESIEGTDSYGRAVAKLGSDGWEMVAQNGRNEVTFKRRVQ